MSYSNKITQAITAITEKFECRYCKTRIWYVTAWSSIGPHVVCSTGDCNHTHIFLSRDMNIEWTIEKLKSPL